MPEITPSRYRMRYTGKEIDDILTSVKFKIDENSITNDWLGGFSKVASAELAKLLYEDINTLKDPNNLLALIRQIPDIQFLSDELKAKIENMSDKFRGVFRTREARNTELVTTQYQGYEVTLILDDGTGFGAWEYWDAVARVWVKVKFYDVGEETPVSLTSASPTTIITLDTTKFNVVKAIVTALKITEVQSAEITVTVTPNKDVYYSVGNVQGSNTLLFTLSCDMNGTDLLIKITASSGAYVKARRVATF